MISTKYSLQRRWRLPGKWLPCVHVFVYKSVCAPHFAKYYNNNNNNNHEMTSVVVCLCSSRELPHDVTNKVITAMKSNDYHGEVIPALTCPVAGGRGSHPHFPKVPSLQPKLPRHP